MTISTSLITLCLTGDQHQQLQAFLFPGDGCEAAALILCGRRAGNHSYKLVAREIYPIPYATCTERTPDSIVWPTDVIVPWLEIAETQHLSVVKVHSHPTGYGDFSQIDDSGDLRLLPAIQGWVEQDIPHASVVMLPGGRMFGRVLSPEGTFIPISLICVIGADIHFWSNSSELEEKNGFAASHTQAFGEGTISLLRHLSVGVVGCSGTGSPIIEQLARLGIGTLVLIDDKTLKERNVNRILNSTMQGAKLNRAKVDVLAESVLRMGLGTRVIAYQKNLWDRECVQAVAECNLVFGCMDSISGRFLLNLIATHYNIPYFDLGVRLEAHPSEPGRIREICGTVHYLQPGKSSLVSRGLVDMAQVAAEGLQRTDPNAYHQQREDGYIRGVEGERPAVISVNMYIASLAINDFLARIHPYRDDPNHEIASIEFSLSSLEFFKQSEDDYVVCKLMQNKVGIGDCEPLLGLTEFSQSIPT